MAVTGSEISMWIALLIMVVIVVLYVMGITFTQIKAKILGPQFTFYPAKTSAGGDLVARKDIANNIDALKQACILTPGCVGFTTDGMLKKTLQVPAKFTAFGTDQNKGLYVLDKV
jgi:flagellar basal body-associated protein FliL